MISLQTQSQPQNKINWPTLMFEADSSKEPFENMTIVTAKSEYILKAKDQAFNYLMSHQHKIKYSEIDDLSSVYMKENNIQVYESASLTDNGVFVCLNVDVINDEAIWLALDMVYKAVEQGGKWISNIPLSFSPLELSIIH